MDYFENPAGLIEAFVKAVAMKRITSDVIEAAKIKQDAKTFIRTYCAAMEEPAAPASGQTESQPFPVLTQTRPEQEGPKVLTYADLLNMKSTEPETLFAPIFPRDGIALVYGAPDCGKSMFLRQMCIHVAESSDFMGWQNRGTTHRALYFSSEDGADWTSYCIGNNDKAYQLSEAAAQNLRFVFDFSSEDVLKTIEKECAKAPVDLIVIDAFGDAFWGKSSNDTNEVRKFYEKFKVFARRNQCLIIFNHHCGKAALTKAPGKESALGSEAIVSAPRLAIEVRRDPYNNDVAHVCIVKGNSLSSDYKTQSFEMAWNRDTMTFTPTGNRIPFDQLVKVEDKQKQQWFRSANYASGNPKNQMPAAASKKQFQDYTDEEHKAFLREVLKPKITMEKTPFKDAICKRFSIGENTARKWVNCYAENKWVAVRNGDRKRKLILLKL
jgi:AAA domain